MTEFNQKDISKIQIFLSRFAVTTPAFSVNVEMSASQKSDVSSVVEFRYQHRICKTLGFLVGRGGGVRALELCVSVPRKYSFYMV
jgi:hypothetical protein